MLKQLFGTRPATKIDVVLAAGAAVMAIAHFFDVKKQYQTDHETEENQ